MPVKCYTGYLQVVVGEHKVVKTQVLLFLPLEFATILSAKHKRHLMDITRILQIFEKRSLFSFESNSYKAKLGFDRQLHLIITLG